MYTAVVHIQINIIRNNHDNKKKQMCISVIYAFTIVTMPRGSSLVTAITSNQGYEGNRW